MTVDLKEVKKLRQLTGAPVLECHAALLGSGGDFKKAQEILTLRRLEVAREKEKREVKEGRIEVYLHTGGRLGAMVEVHCESDFVARNDEFVSLAHELAMQVVATNPKNLKELLSQPTIRDPNLTVRDTLVAAVAKFGENIVLLRFCRYEVGG